MNRGVKTLLDENSAVRFQSTNEGDKLNKENLNINNVNGVDKEFTTIRNLDESASNLSESYSVISHDLNQSGVDYHNNPISSRKTHPSQLYSQETTRGKDKGEVEGSNPVVSSNSNRQSVPKVMTPQTTNSLRPRFAR